MPNTLMVKLKLYSEIKNKINFSYITKPFIYVGTQFNRLVDYIDTMDPETSKQMNMQSPIEKKLGMVSQLGLEDAMPINTESLIGQLSKLNREHKALNDPDAPLPRNKEEVAQEREQLIKSGQLIIDFYRGEFLPNYGENTDPKIRECESGLYALAARAAGCEKNKTCFGFRVLLIPQGSRKGDPNYLEELIETLKKD
jgi:hypothetical protein